MTTVPGRPDHSAALGSAAQSRRRELVVRSETIDLTGTLLGRLPSASGALAWVHRGQGLVGWGEAARLEIDGPDRFSSARLWWQQQAARFTVDDQVGVPGSGPVAFASFAFDDESREPSVLIVPEVVLGRRDGVAWLTTIGTPPRLSSPQPLTPPDRLRYAHGETSVTAFRAAVEEAVRRIGRGELAKVVLAHDLVATADQPIDPRFLLAGLAGRYPDCWTFAVDRLVGATPELLVSLHGGHVTSRVLAGTTARGGDDDEDHRRHQALLQSDKDREEHRYAAESLIDALAPLCSRVTASDAPYLLELSNVAHLATDVTGTAVAGRDVLELVSAVHPTAAVGGTPSDRAIVAIREIEAMDRGRYAGPVGWVDAQGDGEWGIALRCAQLDGHTARLFAGCGIVADSEPDAEVLEAQAKFVPVRDALEGVRDDELGPGALSPQR